MIDKEPLTKDKLCLRELQAFHESLDRKKGWSTDILHNVAYLSEEIGGSLAQNLWCFVKQAKSMIAPAASNPTRYFIDRGKECVGLADEIFVLFEYGESY